MVATIFYKAEAAITSKIEALGLELDEVLRIVHTVVTAHNDATDHDPKSAAGQFRYIYGTRALRDILCLKGWEIDREDNIEAVYHPEMGIKIVYQSVDKACSDSMEPKAISGKGKGAQRLIDRSTSAYLFPDMEDEEQEKMCALKTKSTATTWYLCVSVNGDEVSAEISLPYSVEDDNFKGFIERIYVVSGGDWAAEGIVDLDDDDGEGALEFEPIVSKK